MALNEHRICLLVKQQIFKFRNLKVFITTFLIRLCTNVELANQHNKRTARLTSTTPSNSYSTTGTRDHYYAATHCYLATVIHKSIYGALSTVWKKESQSISVFWPW